jgi:capsular exopolysaccharide synthesis family protein
MDSSNQRLAAFERDMGVINPEQRTSVLSARLLQLNTEFTAAQAERQAKEASFKAMKSGSLEAAQVSSQGDAIAKVNESLLAAKENFASIQASFGSRHPEYRKTQARVDELTRQLEETKNNIARRIETDYRQALAREQMLAGSIAASKAEFDSANAHLFSYQQLKKDADEDRAMYADLVRKVRESSINAGFRNRNIRIADYARPPFKPVTPNLPLNLAASGLVSAFLALGCMIGISAADKTLRSAAQTSRILNVSVLGTLPAVKSLAALGPARQRPLLLDAPMNGGPELFFYEESIRKLRNAILLAPDSGQIRSVMITSAMPGEGKSVTAADLALSCIRQQRRTLLVDADLRRPAVHKRFGIENSVGLGDVLTGDVYWCSAMVRLEEAPGLSILTAGSASVAAADLFGPALRDFLHSVSADFDVVIVDAPPMLPFAEPVQIASSVDRVVLVVHAGKTSAAAAETVISNLHWAGANLLGVVLNRVRGAEAGAVYRHRAYAYGRAGEETRREE